MDDRTANSNSYSGDILRRLRNVWQELLNVSDLRLDDDFFHCGGHSHMALLLTRELSMEFGIRLGLRDVYVNRTLGAQLELIDTALSTIDVSITYDAHSYDASAIDALARSLREMLLAVALRNADA